MSFCKVCGYETKWRTIEGKRVPMGCRCDYGEFGLSQFLRDFAIPITCPKCGDQVFFVRHNGGSVWFDYLGDPWLKHPCFDDPAAGGGGADGSKNRPKPKTANPSAALRTSQTNQGNEGHVFILKLDKTDLGQRFLYVSQDRHAVPILPAPGFWSHQPPPAVGQRVLLDGKNSTIELFPGKGEHRYWKIVLNRCVDCGSHYINYGGHREVCAGRNKKY
jgi:hypothetical protein